MDLLAILNLDELPEQQTRTVSLSNRMPDFNLNLGFDACCCCGKSSPSVECDGCHRVKYCSKACRAQDSAPPKDEDEQALGHSSVICALLSLCNDDEAVEANKADWADLSKKEAATDRVSSEYESYPATIGNIIIDGPCYEEGLSNRKGSTLIIHIVGASHDSELWGGHPDFVQQRNFLTSYAEALAELAEKFKLQSIHLHFVGLECPKDRMRESTAIPGVRKDKSACNLIVQTHHGKYNSETIQNLKIPLPDIVVFFNPGFTCPDYEWIETLACIKEGTPFLVTTNTEVEGIADAQYLVDNDFIREIPVGLAEILGREGSIRDEQHNKSFFSVNPYCGNRVRQSGTMANDLYVKSRWMLGGVFGKYIETGKVSQPAKKRKTEGSGNTKLTNPALV